MATPYPCPLGTCDWELVDDWTPPPPDALASVFGTGVLTTTATATHAQEVEAKLQAHVESHPLSEWVQEVVRLRVQLEHAQEVIHALQVADELED